MVRERFEILHDRRKVELIAGAGETSQSHALEAMMGLQVRKTHLDLLAVVSRFLECRCSFQRTHMIAGVFVYIAWDYALRRVRAALGLQGTAAAIGGACGIAQYLARQDAPRRFQDLASWTDVDVATFVELEVGA